MARRKQNILSDGSDSGGDCDNGSESDFDSQEDEDSRAERRSFERRQRKRPRTGRSGKDSAWEGIFGADDGGLDRRSGSGLGNRQRGGGNSRNDWTKAPTFVSSFNAGAARLSSGIGSPMINEANDPSATAADDHESGDESIGSDGATSSVDSEASTRPPSPRVREPEDDNDYGDGDPPRGMGFAGMKSVNSRLRMGGLQPSTSEPSEREMESEDGPSAFGRRAAAVRDSVSLPGRSNFQSSRSSTPTPAAAKPADLSTADKAHSNKVSGSFGANMLRKFGWAPGKGLGVGEDGRAVPIAVGMLNRGEGIKSGIRTEDSKREARRKGDIVDDVEVTGRKKSRAKGNLQSATDGWKKHKQVKVKVEHKTYEQLIAEDDSTRAGVGLVLDARGGELKTVESLSELSISGWTPTTDTGQSPELRHNLRSILDISKGDVGNLVKEGKSVNERRRWATREEERSRARRDDSAEKLQRLSQVRVLVSEIDAISNEVAKSGASSSEPLAPSFNRSSTDLKDEYTRLSSDEVVVGAIDLVSKPSFDAWEPFDVSSDASSSTLMPWRTAFNLAVEGISLPIHEDRQMTAWESLLWHRWSPKVRSTINNDWSASDAWPAVHLVESWYPSSPDFIRDNVLSQLVLPKVMSAIEAWTGRGRGGDSLASVVFPWLPLLGDRHGEVLEESRRRIRSSLRRWKPADGVPQELARWRSDIFSAREWDTIIGEHVLGKLGAVSRDLVINPRDQDMSAIVNEVLPWHSLIRPSNFTRLFESEFFPKWLNVLYLWLVHPGYNGEEVAQWFELWKSLFPAEVLHHKAIAHGFETGVQLMGAALALGPSRSQDSQRPSYSPLSRSSKSSVGGSKAPSTPAPHVAVRHDDITFRNIAEDFIASKDSLMVPLGKSHSTTGKPLFRVGKTIDGKGGVTVYVGEDAVFAQGDSGSFHAVTLDDVVQRAGGAGHL